MTKQLKKLSIFVAGAACAAAFAFGAGSLPVRTYADAEAKTYDASGIFSRNGATIGGEAAVFFFGGFRYDFVQPQSCPEMV